MRAAVAGLKTGKRENGRAEWPRKSVANIFGKNGKFGKFGKWPVDARVVEVEKWEIRAGDGKYEKNGWVAAKLLEVCACGEVVVAGRLLVEWSEGEVPRFASGRMFRYAFIASAGMVCRHSCVSSFQAADIKIVYTGGRVKDFCDDLKTPRGIGLPGWSSVYVSTRRHSCYGRKTT
jgi:hypothetical protein